MSHTLFVYGTLRPGDAPIVTIQGTLYDLGWFPGLTLDGIDQVTCEKIVVDNLTPFDLYEGYDPSDESSSFYIRTIVTASDGSQGYVYVFNDPSKLSPVGRIPSGDWLDWRKEKQGRASRYVQERRLA